LGEDIQRRLLSVRLEKLLCNNKSVKNFPREKAGFFCVRIKIKQKKREEKENPR
jgi:hypothetical protein